MSYRVGYHTDAWVRAESGAPEWRQVISADLGGGTALVGIVVRSATGGPPRVAEAWIAQPYITRAAGWKRRTIRRLRPQEVEFVAERGVSDGRLACSRDPTSEQRAKRARNRACSTATQWRNPYPLCAPVGTSVGDHFGHCAPSTIRRHNGPFPF